MRTDDIYIYVMLKHFFNMKFQQRQKLIVANIISKKKNSCTVNRIISRRVTLERQDNLYFAINVESAVQA